MGYWNRKMNEIEILDFTTFFVLRLNHGFSERDALEKSIFNTLHNDYAQKTALDFIDYRISFVEVLVWGAVFKLKCMTEATKPPDSHNGH